jgi:hypothetical protein
MNLKFWNAIVFYHTRSSYKKRKKFPQSDVRVRFWICAGKKKTTLSEKNIRMILFDWGRTVIHLFRVFLFGREPIGQCVRCFSHTCVISKIQNHAFSLTFVEKKAHALTNGQGCTQKHTERPKNTTQWHEEHTQKPKTRHMRTIPNTCALWIMTKTPEVKRMRYVCDGCEEKRSG